eukprot:1936130-Rhodomonas_salina.1
MTYPPVDLEVVSQSASDVSAKTFIALLPMPHRGSYLNLIPWCRVAERYLRIRLVAAIVVLLARRVYRDK